MRFTDEPASPRTNPCQTVQVFSAKVTGLEGGLQWPLDVFGFVAIRDSIDHRRNIIFDRTRNNCQTLTKKVGAVSCLLDGSCDHMLHLNFPMLVCSYQLPLPFRCA